MAATMTPGLGGRDLMRGSLRDTSAMRLLRLTQPMAAPTLTMRGRRLARLALLTWGSPSRWWCCPTLNSTRPATRDFRSPDALDRRAEVCAQYSVALHVGDIVDGANDPAQWTVANSSLRLMDGLVPYVLVPGNHDSDSNRVGLIDNYFAPTTMRGSPTP